MAGAVGRIFNVGSTIIITVCAVALTYRAVVPPPPPPPPGEPVATDIDGWREIVAVGDAIEGARTASVNITVFTDYQCPACRALENTLEAMDDSLLSDVAVRYRHMPLEEIHEGARLAALTSMCAGQLGRFDSVHRKLFTLGAGLDTLSAPQLSQLLGLSDVQESYISCIAGAEAQGRLAADVRAAETLGAQGTPSLLINDDLYFGSLPESVLFRAIARAKARLRNSS